MYQFSDRILKLFGVRRRAETHVPKPGRGPVDHVLILDGTMSSLQDMEETNAGLVYKVLSESADGNRRMMYYEGGVQWRSWRHAPDVAMGRGINRQIQRAYSWLASHYREGDRIFLFGYSRGAFAVRSLGGLIDRVGLLRGDAATERNIVLAFRYYQARGERPAKAAFTRRFCHAGVQVEMIGAFDTVKALGMRLPLLWVLTEPQHDFHDHRLGAAVKVGFQALALDETRSVYQPILWDSSKNGARIEQVWFPGSHGDVGGQLGLRKSARALANIPLVWMLERAEASGLKLPAGWQARFPCDAKAPSSGTWGGMGKLFLIRAPRIAGRDPSERMHPSVAARGHKPRARLLRKLGTWSGSADVPEDQAPVQAAAQATISSD